MPTAVDRITQRFVRRFAWLPVRLSDGTRVFWRAYRTREHLIDDESGWTSAYWVTVDRWAI